MAKSTIKVEAVEKTVVVTENVETITIEIDRKEAETLIDVLGHISGCPEYSRRKYTQSVYDAIDAVLMESNQTRQERANVDLRGTMRFTESKDLMEADFEDGIW